MDRVCYNAISKQEFIIMAQVLKDEQRDRIVESAKQEFLENGFENSSMRRIALRSKMTVGNLYRYFRNKDELNQFIVNPAFTAINALVRSLTDNQVDMNSDQFTLNVSVDQLKDMVNRLSGGLVDIYLRHKKEVNILMLNSKLNQQITDWFTRLISALIIRRYHLDGYKKLVDTVSHGYAVAVFSGIRDILYSGNVAEDELEPVIKVYLNSYLGMMDREIADYIDLEEVK